MRKINRPKRPPQPSRREKLLEKAKSLPLTSGDYIKIQEDFVNQCRELCKSGVQYKGAKNRANAMKYAELERKHRKLRKSVPVFNEEYRKKRSAAHKAPKSSTSRHSGVARSGILRGYKVVGSVDGRVLAKFTDKPIHPVQH